MTKLFYFLLGVAGAWLLKSALDRPAPRDGADARRFPVNHRVDGVTAEEELSGPLSEV